MNSLPFLLIICLAAFSSAESFEQFEDWYSAWESSADFDANDQSFSLSGSNISASRQQSLFDMLAVGEDEEAYDLMDQASFYDENLPYDILENVEQPFNCIADVTTMMEFGLSEDGTPFQRLDSQMSSLTCKTGQFAGMSCYFHSSVTRVSGELKVVGFVLQGADSKKCVLAPSTCRSLKARAATKAFVPEGKVGAVCGDESLVFDSQEEYTNYAALLDAEEDQNNALAAMTKSLGTAKILGVPVYHSNERSSCTTSTNYRTVLYQIRNWLRAVSFGKFDIAVHVKSPVRLSYPTSQYNKLRMQKEISPTIFNQKQYAFVMFFNSKISGQNSSAGLGGKFSFINGCSGYNDLNSFFFSTVKHELGHNLGMGHSGRNQEYDDKYAIMGNVMRNNAYHYQAATKWYLNWVTGRVNLGSNTKLPRRSLYLKALNDSSAAGQVQLVTFNSGGKLYTIDHASYYYGDICVMRSRDAKLSSKTRVTHYMVPHKKYYVGSNYFMCSSKLGVGIRTTVLLSVNY